MSENTIVLLSQLFLWVIPGAPLVSAVSIVAFGRWLGEKSHRVCVGALVLSLGLSLGLLVAGPLHQSNVQQTVGEAAAQTGWSGIATGYQWIGQVGSIENIRVDLRFDAMTALMLCTVTLVSLLVAIYASGYMHGDPGYPRFFAAFSLFVFSMCMLVLAGNFLLLFVFWEAVGLCSYLLIGFWYRKPSAAAAARKAFVVNRIGDFGFLMGIFLIWKTFGTLTFSGVLGDAHALKTIAATNPDRITLICLLLFVGAMGKSAQFPLHVWLPDAMEGPTPVSALIHAATMVTAGVYMVARCTPLFVLAPQAQVVIGIIGGITALIAAIIGLTQTDLKRVLAYSTVSQLGYMFMALGAAAVGPEFATAAVTAAMFHLFTHAFFKALLFLGAGSVMHSMGDVIDMRRFSGLAHVMPVTHKTFLIGSAALAGVPLLSGFWSKDDILAVLAHGSHEGPYKTVFLILYGVALMTAVMTAFYTFRAYYLTFHGAERFPEEAGHHPHESPPVMARPLIVLSIFAAGIGLILGPTGIYARYLGNTPGLTPPHGHEFHWGVMALSTLAVVIGIGLAKVMYQSATAPGRQLDAPANPLRKLSQNRLYLDEIFAGILVRPLELFAKLSVLFDQSLLDKLVDIVGLIWVAIGRFLRPIQNGFVQSYALLMLIGLAFFIVAMVR
ncbi:MAG: NADH-quinone oxidoreductase subunit L [Planctomycetaceae bacterium]